MTTPHKAPTLRPPASHHEPDRQDTRWRSRDELRSDVLLWTPTYGRAKAGRPYRTYIEQLCDDTGCSPEDLPETMNDRENWREKVRDIRASGTTWWWWWFLSHILWLVSLYSSCFTSSLTLWQSPTETTKSTGWQILFPIWSSHDIYYFPAFYQCTLLWAT